MRRMYPDTKSASYDSPGFHKHPGEPSSGECTRMYPNVPECTRMYPHFRPNVPDHGFGALLESCRVVVVWQWWFQRANFFGAPPASPQWHRNSSLAATTLRAAKGVRRTSVHSCCFDSSSKSAPSMPLRRACSAGPTKSRPSKKRTVSVTVHERICSVGLTGVPPVPAPVSQAGLAKWSWITLRRCGW